MHDPTEGGVVDALWEMAEASGSGFGVRETSIPVRPATRAICAALGLDPLRLISSGALLIACPDGLTMVRSLVGRGVPATVIGEVTSGGRELIGLDGQVEVVATVTRDELSRFIEAVASGYVARGVHPSAAVDGPPPGDSPAATASDARSTDDGFC